MTAIVDIKTGAIVAAEVSFPYKMGLPDGGITIFKEIGQAEPAHAPVYKAVETREQVSKPEYPVIETGVERVKDGDQVKVTRTYAPDQSAFQRALEAHVEVVAAQRSYSSAVSLASYVASTVPLWKAEAEAFVAWRDAVWTYALAELAKAVDGKRSVPALAAFIAELPAITWPEA